MTMGEKSAVHAARDLKPSVVIPIHMGIKPRSFLLRTNHSPEGFAQRLTKAGLEIKLVILKVGESWTL
jgi:L-ascorbate metabolism protein UlaG (beta-lactamase superfamily)